MGDTPTEVVVVVGGSRRCRNSGSRSSRNRHSSRNNVTSRSLPRKYSLEYLSRSLFKCVDKELPVSIEDWTLSYFGFLGIRLSVIFICVDGKVDYMSWKVGLWGYLSITKRSSKWEHLCERSERLSETKERGQR